MISDISNIVVQSTLIYPDITDISQFTYETPNVVSTGTAQNQYTNILLIDRNVPSYQTFVDSANDSTFPIVFSNDCSGNELVNLLRTNFTTTERIGFVFTSTGNQSTMFLDNQPFFEVSSGTLTESSCQFMIDLIGEFSIQQVDFLACDTLKYPVWKTYYEFLKQSTGVIVGASDNKTGNIKYGGDWILESTSEDIETVYFTQSIEYYQYLLDTLQWATAVINKLSGLGTDGTYLYCGTSMSAGGENTLGYANSINRISIASPTSIDRNWASYSSSGILWQFTEPLNGFIYFVATNNNGILKLNLTTGGSSTAIATSIYQPNGVALYNGNLYAASNQYIYKVSPTGVIDTTWGSSGRVDVGTSVDLCAVSTDGNLYVGTSGYIARVNLNTATKFNAITFGGVYIPSFIYGALTIHNNYLYSGVNQALSRVNLSNYADISLNWRTLSTATYSFTYNSTTSTHNAFYYEGIVGYQYRIYAGINLDPVDRNRPSSFIHLYDLPVPLTIPLNTVSFDVGNTVSTSLGNLQVSIIDPSNVSTNAVYYWYSTDGITYINSNIANNGPTQTQYNFNITGLNGLSKTIYVYAKNTAGNTTPVSITSRINNVPSRPNSYSASFSLDTGLQVSITDTNNPSSNNVFYYYYYFRVGDTAPNQSGNIAVYSNSYVSLSANSYTSSFYIPNLLKGDYNIYVAAVNSYGANIYTPAIPPVSVICFKHDSRILTNRGYKKIQHLKKGDLVKTFQDGFKPVHQIGKKEIEHTPTLERSKNHLYKCSPSQYPELFEDLVLTGCHSILVDDFVDEEQIQKTEETLGSANYITDGKWRLPVCADRRASIYERAGKYTVYHVALENDDYYMNYGIYANGLLVESTSKRFLDQFHIMEK